MARAGGLHFYRCGDCLAVVSTVESLEHVATPEERKYTGRHFADSGICGACGGTMASMGQVRLTRLVRSAQECPCDGKCTSALGPNCDCSCGGANHGKNTVVTVTRDAGTIPVVNTPQDALKVATAYREACEAFRTAWRACYGAITERKNGGEYVREFDFYLAGQFAWRRFNGARVLKVQKTRLASIARLTAEVQKKSANNC